MFNSVKLLRFLLIACVVLVIISFFIGRCLTKKDKVDISTPTIQLDSVNNRIRLLEAENASLVVEKENIAILLDKKETTIIKYTKPTKEKYHEDRKKILDADVSVDSQLLYLQSVYSRE